MRNQLKKIQNFRAQLEQYRHKVGLGKWADVLRCFRYAGAPRAVIVSQQTLVLTDLLQDQEVPDAAKQVFARIKDKLSSSAAFRERAWLD